MALDTQEKRMAAVGVGRPWLRSKLPGSNDQEWRIASGNAWGGNAIASAAMIPGLEFTLPVNRMHFTAEENRMQHTLPVNRMHFTIPEDD